MTLIAFTADTDHAEIVTDTLSYSLGNRYVATAQKVTILDDLNVAVMTQGSTIFGDAWVAVAQRLASEAADFDEFDQAAAAALPEVWEEVRTDIEWRRARPTGNSIAFHVGYSPAEERYRGFAYASDLEFRPVEPDGLYVMPTPLNARPAPIEQSRLFAHFDRNFGDTGPVGRLTRQPPPPVPATVGDWVALARLVRRDRALAHLYSGFNTPVGGEVVHTRLDVGGAHQEVIHVFDDTGDEFAQMMAHSFHPLGQLGPCYCGSGRSSVTCCFRKIENDPCPCGSGDTFAACCRVDVPAPAPAAGKAGRNDPCPCRSGKKAKRCCALAGASR